MELAFHFANKDTTSTKEPDALFVQLIKNAEIALKTQREQLFV